jgi:hypothetical protein
MDLASPRPRPRRDGPRGVQNQLLMSNAPDRCTPSASSSRRPGQPTHDAPAATLGQRGPGASGRARLGRRARHGAGALSGAAGLVTAATSRHGDSAVARSALSGPQRGTCPPTAPSRSACLAQVDLGQGPDHECGAQRSEAGEHQPHSGGDGQTIGSRHGNALRVVLHLHPGAGFSDSLARRCTAQ